MSTWIVQPGELWDRQLGALTGWRQKTDFTVAEIEMVKLTKKQIADVIGFQAIITTTAGDRSVARKRSCQKVRSRNCQRICNKLCQTSSARVTRLTGKFAAIFFSSGTDVVCFK